MRQHVSRSVTAPTAQSFDEVVLPHLDAARRLARWLMRNEHDADDALQEAALRAFRYFATFSGGDGRAWFLSIVRNTCRGWRMRPLDAATDPFDEEHHSSPRCKSDPEALMHHNDAALLIARAMRQVPDRVRELLVLREVEGLSYRELADLLQLPRGTVMSRLSRARATFRGAMTATLEQHGIPRRHILPDERAAPAALSSLQPMIEIVSRGRTQELDVLSEHID
jgi:RNA polymerase sigma-70 factor (ECF subfamily)